MHKWESTTPADLVQLQSKHNYEIVAKVPIQLIADEWPFCICSLANNAGDGIVRDMVDNAQVSLPYSSFAQELANKDGLEVGEPPSRFSTCQQPNQRNAMQLAKTRLVQRMPCLRRGSGTTKVVAEAVAEASAEASAGVSVLLYELDNGLT